MVSMIGMVNMVGTRPNHYQALGLEPGASDDEIKRAFARRMGLFPSPADAALIGIAYETLRNPGKRRAYDQSLGLGSVPKRLPIAVSFAGSARFSAIAPRIEPAAEPAPFIAAPKLAAPSPKERQELLARPSLRPAISNSPVIEPGLDMDTRPITWNRAAMAVGALVVGVALIGAWAGSQAGSAEEPQPSARSVRMTLPPPKVVVRNDAAPVATPIRGFTAHPMRAHPAPRAVRSVDRLAEVSKTLESAGDTNQVADAAPAATAPESSLVETAAASLPLSNATIARTIERIGYSCGEVASTSAGDAPGVYTVSCTSGQSYQAKPVHGRYRFRRLH